MAVQLNDIIEIPASGWTDLIEIKWQQSMKQRTAKYYKVPFTNTTSGREQGKDLFIQEEKAEELKKLGTVKDSKLSLPVTLDFVNGQGKDGKNRWLVYHDKSRECFQHRFSQGVLMKYMTLAQEAVEKMGYYNLKGLNEIVSGLVGDKLNAMDKK
ncbi:uncharacterized protein RCC_02122 [Ramularia collo-cygni]|uniref:Uncharacterized protein n=1 Tax=Ramularia collo-cygni TaxID=112498 RepID=A0A2D3UTU0_9PEZI|nr:uncharacterized protein RCC_02122 [Ramularia collo-cygni]CZT16280.1 uncharacterized protein RCC_02122 [Ramularia collo-cygni]